MNFWDSWLIFAASLGWVKIARSLLTSMLDLIQFNSMMEPCYNFLLSCYCRPLNQALTSCRLSSWKLNRSTAWSCWIYSYRLLSSHQHSCCLTMALVTSWLLLWSHVCNCHLTLALVVLLRILAIIFAAWVLPITDASRCALLPLPILNHPPLSCLPLQIDHLYLCPWPMQQNPMKFIAPRSRH